MTQAMRTPIFSIPGATEYSGVFLERLASLIVAKSTHVYIDTSFLMWMTKIGSTSRKELIDWLQSNCKGRVHVPIWAAHEYLKHHVARTIVTDLAAKSKELDGLIRRTYVEFRPFIDEPPGEGAKDPSAIRAETRMALNALNALPQIGRQWQKSYENHASEVITFINELTPRRTSVYKNLKDIARTGQNRFAGSVPPGINDRRKKGRAIQSEDSSHEAPTASNRYGDLHFWKEVLIHARHAKAKGLVVITNDRKNDWYLGGHQRVDVDASLRALKQEWKPVPRPHPMLVLEAKLVAKVDRVELLDSAYLAALLREMAQDEVRAFADVAIVPDGPGGRQEPDNRAKMLQERVAADTAKARSECFTGGYLFPDPKQVQDTPAAFARALYESRTSIDEASDLIVNQWRATADAKRPLSETVNAETLNGLDHRELATLARELHDRVLLKTSGYGEAVADLVSLLDRLPPRTAASLYLGLISSMYLIRKSNNSRLPPSSPVAQRLFNRQSAGFAVNGIHVVANRLSKNKVAPLYIPNSDPPKVPMTIDAESNGSGIDQLRSLKIKAIQLLTPAQSDDSLRLGALFDSSLPIDSESIVRKACELFCIPFAQVKREELFDQTYTLTENIGFKRPTDVYVPREQPNGE